MDLSTGAKKKKGAAAAPKPASKKSRKSTRRSRKTPKSPKPRRPALPKTVRMASRKSKSFERIKASRAGTGMSLTELQFMAKSRGIPFGGLSRAKLIKKINNYY